MSVKHSMWTMWTHVTKDGSTLKPYILFTAEIFSVAAKLKALASEVGAQGRPLCLYCNLNSIWELSWRKLHFFNEYFLSLFLASVKEQVRSQRQQGEREEVTC